MTLSELMDQFLGDREEEELTAVAEQMLNHLLKNRDLLVELLTPVLRSELHNRLRYRTRQTERNSFLSRKQADPMADRNAFLLERFYVPKVGFVTWADATVDDHRVRIEYLTEKILGITETVERHETAIKQITASHVKCLGEFYAQAMRESKKAARARKAS